MYAGGVCSAVTQWVFLNVRPNLLQVLFDPSSAFQLRYEGLSVYPPSRTVCAYRACVALHDRKKTNTRHTEGALLTARGSGESAVIPQIPLMIRRPQTPSRS